MNFFKRLFSGNKDQSSDEVNKNQSAKDSAPKLEGISTNEYFDKRYEEVEPNASMDDGTLKMIESYFIENKVTPSIKDPINHPINLDQTVNEGLGFVLYCSAYGIEENSAVGILAMAFNEYMIKNYGFKLYKDSAPEYPLRGMTIKYDHNGTKLSAYPFEYAAKVMNYEASFEDLYKRLKQSIEEMPSMDDLLKDFLPSERE